ncbi:MocE family 2Fe-2S type ferredoxin [Aliamphritea spongicola]|uniref:MocE family 2Fe-2S type ferredoxin n=1 Tax=Aliamphritea spongicola TaxID=707589 RepID=UPI00196AC78A|nr:MocE family 2Fe-2S type ferredoxin [Aliamphritea spongicola]MBN3562352.1 Rieske 2Fe-2S domain-containing protein [Aliamphritea spongicola]
MNFIDVCDIEDIDEEDVMRFDHGDETFAIYRTEEGYFATAGLCTHEEVHLEDGLVIDDVIECPLHQGRFNVRTGEALSAPACVNLKTYPVKVEGRRVMMDLDG